MSDRRAFLCGLGTLPIVGSVALIGQPIAAAVPVTDALHERYLAFLAFEHRAAMREHAFRGAMAHYRARLAGNVVVEAETYARQQADRADYMNWFPEAADIEALVASDRPSSRAAVVLATVGVGLTGGRHG